jgi:ArsR family transcriptional regulator
VCELTAALGAGQSRLSFHLRTLKEAGLVRDRRDGRWMYYAVDPAAVAEVGALLERGSTEPRRQLPVLV